MFVWTGVGVLKHHSKYLIHGHSEVAGTYPLAVRFGIPRTHGTEKTPFGGIRVFRARGQPLILNLGLHRKRSDTLQRRNRKQKRRIVESHIVLNTRQTLKTSNQDDRCLTKDQDQDKVSFKYAMDNEYTDCCTEYNCQICQINTLLFNSLL